MSGEESTKTLMKKYKVSTYRAHIFISVKKSMTVDNSKKVRIYETIYLI